MNLLYKQGFNIRQANIPQMSNERCAAYTDGTIERPIETLQKACRDTAEKRRSIKAGQAVVHWFKRDLRLHDNRALNAASELAKEHNVPLIGLYILSPGDLTAHSTSPARVDFIRRTLAQLQTDLAELDIPLHMETQEQRKAIPARVVELCQRWGANHLYANIEYEVDELRRDARLVRLCAEKGIDCALSHDACVVPPGAVSTQQGKQFAVYTPWYRAWLVYLKENPDYLELSQEPGSNPGNARKQLSELFDCKIPPAPNNKQLSDEEKTRFEKLYPAGEHEGLEQLETFLQKRVSRYSDLRSVVAGENTSILSPYFACGALSARTAVFTAKKANKNQLDKNDNGFVTWISELAWRDFYRHVLVHWPFIW